MKYLFLLLILLLILPSVSPATVTLVPNAINVDKVKTTNPKNMFDLFNKIPFVPEKPCGYRNSTFIVYQPEYDVFHIYNLEEDYWVNKTSGMQITQDIPNYWTKNYLCINVTLRIGNNNRTFYYCTDTLNLQWTNTTDEFASFAELNGTSPLVAIGQYRFQFKVRYYLADAWRHLSVSYYINNSGTRDVYDVSFFWLVRNIKINNSYTDNLFVVNSTWNSVDIYDIKDLSMTFNSSALNERKYEIYKKNTENLNMFRIRLDWLNDYDYLLKVEPESGQYNSPVMLKQNIGTIFAGTMTELKYYWEDANSYTRACTEATVGGTCSCNYVYSDLPCTTAECYTMTTCTATCPAAYANSTYSSNTCTFGPGTANSCCDYDAFCLGG